MFPESALESLEMEQIKDVKGSFNSPGFYFNDYSQVLELFLPLQFFFYAALCGLWDLCSLTKALGSESMES